MENLSKMIYNTHSLVSMFNRNADETKSDFLDPLSVIIMLGMIGYKQVGTKLRIVNNSICINENTIIQGIIRNISGDKRSHLKLLYDPIINACKNFLILENLSKSTHLNIIELDKQFSKTEKLKAIFRAALRGLNNLKQTYSQNDNEIIHLLTIYTNIIDKCLSEDENIVEFLDKLTELSRPKDLLMNEEYNNIIKLRSDIYSQFNNLWSVNKINMFVNIFSELETKNIVNRENIFRSIVLLLQDVHSDVKLLLKSFQQM